MGSRRAQVSRPGAEKKTNSKSPAYPISVSSAPRLDPLETLGPMIPPFGTI